MTNLLKNNLIKLKIENKSKCYYINLSSETNNETDLDKIAGIIYTEPAVLLINKTDSMTDKTFTELAKKIKLLCGEFNSTLIICNRADIAFLINADGLYLDSSAISAHDAKSITGENIIVGSENITEHDRNHSDFTIENNLLITQNARLKITEIK